MFDSITSTQLIILAVGCAVAFLLIVAVLYYFGNKALIKQEQTRQATAEGLRPQWGNTTTDSVLNKKLLIGMTTDQVMLAWGKPSIIDQKETTSRSSKERWIYGTPRRDARYVYFKDGEVIKIQES